MDIHLSHVPGDEPIHFYLNGQLVCEIALGQADTRDTLSAEVAAARGLQHLACWVAGLPAQIAALATNHDHVHKKPEQRQAAFLRGLAAGIAGTTHPHPASALLPGLPPEETQSYRLGYEEGQAWARVVSLSKNACKGD